MNFALGIAGVEAAVFLRELPERRIRLSLRSKGQSMWPQLPSGWAAEATKTPPAARWRARSTARSMKFWPNCRLRSVGR